MPIVEPSVEIAHRHDFNLLCNARGYKYAAEVGVDLGVFAEQFLSRWDGDHYWAVDPYLPYSEHGQNREMDMLTAVQALLPWKHKVRFVMASSPSAAGMIPPWCNGLDFVYIDGAHEYESVVADLRAWWTTLKPSGMLAGHDYDDDHPGVTRAVNEFFGEEVVVRLTTEFNRSWYVYRTEPRVLFKRYYDHGEMNNPRWRG